MKVLGLHCSHKQAHPRALLAAVQQAEAAGFDAAMSSDHFSPWSSRQEQEAFVDAFGQKVLPQLRSAA